MFIRADDERGDMDWKTLSRYRQLPVTVTRPNVSGNGWLLSAVTAEVV
jgi:hypothetical protein